MRHRSGRRAPARDPHHSHRWAPHRHEALLAYLGGRDPSTPGLHLALAGVLRTAQAMLDALDWSVLEPDFVARFERDRALLRIAGRARDQRRVRAWAAFGRVL